MSIENCIAHWALERPDKVAIATPTQQLTYKTLWTLIGQRAAELRDNGIIPGHVIPLRTRQDISFMVDYLAIHYVGAVALPMEHDMPEEFFKQTSQRFAALSLPEGTADILLTSGSTGKAKGVIISSDAIYANAENLTEAHGYSSDLTFIVTGPLNHLGSLSKTWTVMMVGATLYILEGMKNFQTFFQTIGQAKGQVATFLVPAQARMLIQLASRQLLEYAGKLDFVECGAAPLTGTDMLNMCELLPHTRLYNTYASTETGVVCTYNFNDGKSLSSCVGSMTKHASIRLTVDGTIACSGPMMMTGYADDDDLTRQVLQNGVFYTSDRGHFDSEGRLFLDGRTDEIINVGGYKVSPEEVEQAAMTIDGVADCVCIRVSSNITGQALKLLVVTRDGAVLDRREMARQLSRRLEAYKVPLEYEQVETIVRTFNGKTDRSHYRLR